MPQLLAKFVPLVQTLILVGIDVRARSRFDRFTHHAHGHGGWIAAGGDVGSRFPVARSVDDGASATGVSHRATRSVYFIPVKCNAKGFVTAIPP